MLWFFFCVALLLAGYFFYSRVIERIFVINPNRQTPAYTMNDGVDYMPMSKTKIWLIQLLNIAGTGPIFGPILGALYGPVAVSYTHLDVYKRQVLSLCTLHHKCFLTLKFVYCVFFRKAH